MDGELDGFDNLEAVDTIAEQSALRYLKEQGIGVAVSDDVIINAQSGLLNSRKSIPFSFAPNQDSINKFAQILGIDPISAQRIALRGSSAWIRLFNRSKFAQSGQGASNCLVHNYSPHIASFPFDGIPACTLVAFHPDSMVSDYKQLDEVKHIFHPDAEVVPVRFPDIETGEYYVSKTQHRIRVPIDTYYEFQPNNGVIDLGVLFRNFSHADRERLNREIGLTRVSKEVAFRNLVSDIERNPMSGFVVSATSELCIPNWCYAEVSPVQVDPGGEALYHHIPALLLKPQLSDTDRRNIRWEHSCLYGKNPTVLPSHVDLTIFRAFI